MIRPRKEHRETGKAIIVTREKGILLPTLLRIYFFVFVFSLILFLPLYYIDNTYTYRFYPLLDTLDFLHLSLYTLSFYQNLCQEKKTPSLEKKTKFWPLYFLVSFILTLALWILGRICFCEGFKGPESRKISDSWVFAVVVTDVGRFFTL